MVNSYRLRGALLSKLYVPEGARLRSGSCPCPLTSLSSYSMQQHMSHATCNTSQPCVPHAHPLFHPLGARFQQECAGEVSPLGDFVKIGADASGLLISATQIR